MIKLFKNAEVYAPRYLGKTDVLAAGGKIAAVGPDISGCAGLAGAEVIDLAGKKLIPGLIDLHVHITGGGGESGPVSRVPEINLSELTLAGITTAVGLLGTDGVSRSQENLLAKCRALNLEGITCFCLCGSYQYPPVTVTGSVVRDISLLEHVIGVKTAMSDHRSSGVSGDELIRLAADARLGGLISGKAGITTIHVGKGADMLGPLLYALERSDVPVKNFVATHLGRSKELIKQGSELAARGGNADFTASEDRTAADIVYGLVMSGQNPGGSGITISSDAGGSLPKFDESGECIGMDYSRPGVMLKELQRLVLELKMPLETALLFQTANAAKVIGMKGVKGEIVPGADADLLIVDDRLGVLDVYAKGKQMVRDGAALVKGMFES